LKEWLILPCFTNFRLVWALNNIPALKTALLKGDVMFGTVDTWLLYKFSAGSLHLTDISNAAATGKRHFKRTRGNRLGIIFDLLRSNA
jgi:glycerol kinase